MQSVWFCSVLRPISLDNVCCVYSCCGTCRRRCEADARCSAAILIVGTCDMYYADNHVEVSLF
jgi:hypothetical protein